jgi:hypothetical protein
MYIAYLVKNLRVIPADSAAAHTTNINVLFVYPVRCYVILNCWEVEKAMDKKKTLRLTDLEEIIRRGILDILDVASKQFLIICSPGVKHTSELKVVSSICFNVP